MTHGLGQPQGGFRAPRVPLDLRCVILAILGYLSVCAVDLALGQLYGKHSPVAQMVALVAEQLGHIAFLGDAFQRAMEPLWGKEKYALTFWQSIGTGLCFFAVWGVFGGAVLRTAALKLSRDEPLSLKEALRFGAKNWVNYLLAPVLVIAFGAFFGLCNMAAGFIMSLWFVGSTILALVLVPLALIAALLIILAVMGGIVGLPLMWAGISVEQNGALEALSRAFSYIFARPFRFFFAYFLLFVIMSILLLAGSFFESTLKTSLQAGVVREALDDAISKEPGEVDVLEDEYRDSNRVTRQKNGIADIRNIGDLAWYDMGGFFLMWLFLSLFLLGFKGYALYLFLGGTTSLYLQLRYEVDGTDEDEIYPESEEELEPRWVGETAPAPAKGAEEAPSED